MEHIAELRNLSRELSRTILSMLYYAGSGHPGGSLSAVDVITYLVDRRIIFMDHNNQYQSNFFLSKGHAAPLLYAVAIKLGFENENEVLNFRKIGGKFQGHPHVGTTPWAGASTGSLAQGFSVAVGKALGYQYLKLDRTIYALLGDGELQEGEVWEAAMCAAHYKLHKLCVIVDYNKLQSDDLNENIMAIEPLSKKWEAFNWQVIEIDGHNFQQIESAFVKANAELNKPTVIIAHTIKGKGVSFMEGVPAWHGSVAIKPHELEVALRELGASDTEIVKVLSKNTEGVKN